MRRISPVSVFALFTFVLFSAVHAADAVVPVVPNVAKNPTEVGTPVAGRTMPTTIHMTLNAEEYIAELAPGKQFYFWTFNGTVPAPMIRAMEGDTLDLTICNKLSNVEPHNVDFHAVMGPGGGAAVTGVEPGQCKNAKFKMERSGAYIYHCAGEGLPWEHVAHGMYGLIMVEPVGGLPTGYKEFYVGQDDWYLTTSASSDPKVADSSVLFYNL